MLLSYQGEAELLHAHLNCIITAWEIQNHDYRSYGTKHHGFLNQIGSHASASLSTKITAGDSRLWISHEAVSTRREEVVFWCGANLSRQWNATRGEALLVGRLQCKLKTFQDAVCKTSLVYNFRAPSSVQVVHWFEIEFTQFLAVSQITSSAQIMRRRTGPFTSNGLKAMLQPYVWNLRPRITNGLCLTQPTKGSLETAFSIMLTLFLRAADVLWSETLACLTYRNPKVVVKELVKLKKKMRNTWWEYLLYHPGDTFQHLTWMIIMFGHGNYSNHWIDQLPGIPGTCATDIDAQHCHAMSSDLGCPLAGNSVVVGQVLQQKSALWWYRLRWWYHWII